MAHTDSHVCHLHKPFTVWRPSAQPPPLFPHADPKSFSLCPCLYLSSPNCGCLLLPFTQGNPCVPYTLERAGPCCPEWYCLMPWTHSRSHWLWATWSSCSCPWPWQKGWTSWPLAVTSNKNYSMIVSIMERGSGSKERGKRLAWVFILSSLRVSLEPGLWLECLWPYRRGHIQSWG